MPLHSLGHLIDTAKLSIGRIQAILALPVLPQVAQATPSEPHLQPNDASVVFDQVSFRYDGDSEPALQNVSFTAAPGTVTALVGPSGAGKTTVARLIPRFWDVTEGRILVGGVDVRELPVDTLMQQVSFVFQDTFLFSGSIADNIRLGLQEGDHAATLDAVKAAARAAQAHDFIEQLPQGYDTLAGERGTFLSGGQRQRITIARAILQNRPILVLDEATAFADPENEAAIVAALSALMRGKTVLMVAHRLSTIRDADQILVFDRGRLCEQGQHDALLKADGIPPVGELPAGAKLGVARGGSPGTDICPRIFARQHARGDRTVNAAVPTPAHKITPWHVTYRQLLKSVGDRAPQLRRALFWLLAAAATQGAALACLYPILTALLQHETAVWMWLAVMTALMGLATVLRWLGQGFDYNGNMLHATHVLRTRLGEQLRRMPLLTLQDQRSGEVNATLLGNVDENLMYSLTIVNALLGALVTPLVVALATLLYDWRLGLLMLVVFPAIVPLYRQRRPAFARGMRALDAALHKTSADIVEYMQGLPVMRSARCEGEKAQTLQAGFAHLQRIQTLGHQKGTKPSLLMATIIEAGLLGVAAVGLWWVAQGSLPLAVIAAALVLTVRFAEPLTNFVSFTAILEMIETALERVEALLAVQPLPQREPAQTPHTFDIRFEDLRFCWPGNPVPVLDHINLTIPERGMTALVGPSGSGKTTLTRLLLRHFDPDQGAVVIGGVDLRQIPPERLNTLVSIVFQDVYLFDDTVRANIHMARPDASLDEVAHAARMAQCDFINRLPQGWETRLGDVGGRLSGGERQRISIARALLKNAPILILDEPTAALDTQSERAVQAAIDTLVQEKTVIVIAHRLSTIAGADQIVVLDAGRVVQTGTHAALLQQQNGRYARMWAAQQRVKNWHVGQAVRVCTA